MARMPVGSSRLWLSTLALSTVSAAILYFYWRGRRLSQRRLRQADEEEKKRARRRYAATAELAKTAPVLNSLTEFVRQWPEFENRARQFGYCGLDCEWRWRTELGVVGQLALLQLATADGLILLIRVQKFSEVPEALEAFLADADVLKFGVGIDGDAAKILDGIGVRARGLVDIRDLLRLRQIPTGRQGLKSLSAQLLGLDYFSLKSTAMSDWEAPRLNSWQVEYAAMDALVGALLPLEAARRCRHAGGMSEFCDGVIDLERQSQPTSSREEASAGGQKSASSARLSARKNPLYHNCQMLAPDDQLMCTLDLRRAEWYVDRQLAEVVTRQPCYTIRLLFEPRQRPDRQQQMYYLADKINQCVVCGSTQDLMRRKIVPDEYRRHFPEFLKSRKSHDIVLLCIGCHVKCDRCTEALKRRLAAEYSAPNSAKGGAEDRSMRQAKSSAKALLANLAGRAKIPPARIQQLEENVKSYLDVEELTTERLESLMKETTDCAESEAHGSAVVRAVLDERRILEFEEMWRKHFLQTMKPQFLPEHWSTDHLHELLRPAVEQFLSERATAS